MGHRPDSSFLFSVSFSLFMSARATTMLQPTMKSSMAAANAKWLVCAATPNNSNPATARRSHRRNRCQYAANTPMQSTVTPANTSGISRPVKAAAGVSAAMIFRAHPFVADFFTPHVSERPVRHEHRRGVWTFSGCLDEFGRLLVGDHGLRETAELVVAADVVTVMVGVDEAVHRAILRPLVEAGDEQLRGIRKLAVNGDHAGRVHQIADRAATAGEKAHVAPHLGEHRIDRRRRLLLLLPGGGKGRAAKGGGANRNSGGREKVSSGQGHMGSSGSDCIRVGTP